MKRSWIAVSASVVMLAGTIAFAQGESQQGQGQAVVTVLPKHDGELPASVTQQDMSLKVNGKAAKITYWAPLKGPEDRVELVVLIDGGARSSLGGQLDYLAHFINSLPPNTKAGVAYMENGRAAFQGPLSAEHAQVSKGLHITGGISGMDASPYFCLTDLAKNWPSQDTDARREVVMVTDGVDYYQMHYDPEDPYVQAAANDAVRARLVVYAIYWMNQGRADRTSYENNAGQNLILQVTQATGGKSFWEGMGNPVSLEPYLDDLTRRLRNQYELRFVSHLNGKPQVETLKLNLSAPGTEVDTPQQVYVVPAAPAQN
jgi:hypothetical protein